jgi:hypothetical protein
VKLAPIRLVAPALALLLLLLMAQQTVGALHDSGTWARLQSSAPPPPDPYSRLDRLLVVADSGTTLAALRDPFAYSRATVAVSTIRKPTSRPTTDVTPVAVPVLTAIVWDNDPRASVHWNDRDYSVRVNSLFDDFRVKSISRDQLVLEHAGESIVLQLAKKGE